MTILDYLKLVTSEHQGKPNFKAALTANVSLATRIQDLMSSLISAFDVDTAVGDQLDIIGKWVGITRNVSIPISGVFFSWDGDYTVGWEYGVWPDNLAPTEVTTLPDDVYRTLIKAKIAANRWNGTINDAYAIWDSIFTTITILIVDNLDMSYDLALVNGIVDSLTLALLVGGYIPLKPSGIRVRTYYVSVDTGPVFGWDVDSSVLQGWDTGSWVRELSPT